MSALNKVEITHNKSIKDNLKDLFGAWHDDAASLYDYVMNSANAGDRMSKIMDGFIKAIQAKLKQLSAIIEDDKELYKTMSFNDVYGIKFGSDTPGYQGNDAYLDSFVKMDPKARQVFSDAQQAVIDASAQILLPPVLSTDTYPAEDIIVSENDDAPYIRSSFEDNDNEQVYTLIKRNSQPADVVIEISYSDPLPTINFLNIDLSPVGAVDITGLQYFDETSSVWVDVPIQAVKAPTFPYKIHFDTLTNQKRFRVKLRLYYGMYTDRMQGTSYQQFTNTDLTGSYLYIYGFIVNNIEFLYTQYANIAYFVAPGYKTRRPSAILPTIEKVSSTSGAIELYAAIQDFDADGHLLGIKMVPLPHKGIGELTDMIVYPDPNTLQFKTCFPIDTSKPYSLTLNGTAVDTADYTIDYNTVTLTSVSDGRYAFTYTPMFVGSYKLFTLEKEDRPDTTEVFSTSDGTIDSDNGTITFALEKRPDVATIVVTKDFNGTTATVDSTDVSVDNNNVIISNFNASAPADMNATYTITYKPEIFTYDSNHFYYFGPNSAVIISNNAKDKAYGSQVEWSYIYPIVIFRDIDNQVNNFAAVKQLRFFLS